MAMKYRERITDFITTINNDKSYRINDELIQAIKLNQSNLRWAEESKTMRSTFRTEKERIFANILNNSIYDSCPSQSQNKSFELRPRIPEKELADAKIRYKPKYLLERVKDAVDKNSFLFAQDHPRSKSTTSPHARSIQKSTNKGEYFDIIMSSMGNENNSSGVIQRNGFSPK